MSSAYDAIAEGFKEARQRPAYLHVESYTFLGLVGDVTGKAVLDLACGEGTYTRALRRRGARRVVGVDVSAGMIELARREEAREPLGVEYVIQDVTALDLPERFDVVTAAYLLNHARTAAELEAMCRAVARALKPGGRFVAVNNNLDQPPETYPLLKKYGYTKSAPGGLVEGAPIKVIFFVNGGTVEVEDCYLSRQTYEEAFRVAGLKDLRWHPLRLSPAGEAEFGRDYWKDLLDHPPAVCLDCTA